MGVLTSLVLYRILFTILGCFVLAAVIYTTVTDGSPFRTEVLNTPWIIATWIDFYVNVVALSVWVVYKESNWMTSAIWVVLLVCFGSEIWKAILERGLQQVHCSDKSRAQPEDREEPESWSTYSLMEESDEERTI